MHFFTAAAHLSASHRDGDGEKLSHCLHGATLERQPEMFDKAPEEKRSVNRYTAVKRVCNLSVFNGTVKQQWLTKDFVVCPRSSFSNCARKRKNDNKKLTGVSTLVLVVRSRDVAAITAAVLLLLCCCCCAAAAVLLLLLFHDPRCIAKDDPQC